MRKGLIYFIFIALTLGCGLAVGLIARPDGWYAALAKPPFNPPNWIFGPVWTTLYVLMGVAAWRVWLHRGDAAARRATALFLVQLTLNVAWSGLFFGLRNPAAAFVEIVALWAAVAATTVAFLRIERTAGTLLLPYLAWITFAAYLNFGIWSLNA